MSKPTPAGQMTSPHAGGKKQQFYPRNLILYALVSTIAVTYPTLRGRAIGAENAQILPPPYFTLLPAILLL